MWNGKPSGSSTTIMLEDDVCGIFGSIQLAPQNSKQKEKAKMVSVNFDCDSNMGLVSSLSTLPYESVRNRVVAGHGGSRNFIHVSFSQLLNKNFLLKDLNAEKMIENVATSGILIQHSTTGKTRKFFFCGHSNSQLKSGSCFFFGCKNPKDAEKILKDFGDFSPINSVEKCVKRIGLLFSTAKLDDIKVREEDTIDIPDIERHGHIFTDGCGLIRESYAHSLMKTDEKKRLSFCDISPYIPSVFQIRYKGYKGILMVTPDDEMDKHISASSEKWYSKILRFFHMDTKSRGHKTILFRNSMKKFGSCSDDTLAILDYSKPSFVGALNAETVNLLCSNGIHPDVIIEKQTKYLEYVRDVPYDKKEDAIKFLKIMNRFDLIAKFKNSNGVPNWIQSQIQSLKSKELGNSFNDQKIAKVHIKIPESRLLLGVADTSGKLEEGQCYVRLTSDDMHSTFALIGKILVARNPCLFPGDIQVLIAQDDIPELAHLKDCIVFNTRGKLPVASMLSGGDLDGDKFFVCWDRQLLEMNATAPLDYSLLAPKNAFVKKVSWEHRIQYFAYYSTSLGMIMSLYWKWIKADLTLRARSNECRELSKLYCRCVDGEKIDIPKELQRPPLPRGGDSMDVIDILKENAKRMLSCGKFDGFLQTVSSRGTEKHSGSAPSSLPNGCSTFESRPAKLDNNPNVNGGMPKELCRPHSHRDADQNNISNFTKKNAKQMMKLSASGAHPAANGNNDHGISSNIIEFLGLMNEGILFVLKKLVSLVCCLILFIFHIISSFNGVNGRCGHRSVRSRRSQPLSSGEAEVTEV